MHEDHLPSASEGPGLSSSSSVMPAQAGTHASILGTLSVPQSIGVDPRLRADDVELVAS